MNYSLAVIFSFSAALAALIGWIRFSRIGAAYRPFIILVTVATLNELISFLITRKGGSNAVNVNIYSLVEGLLITWQFYQWKLLRMKTMIFFFIILSVSWTTEVVFISGLDKFSSYYIVVESLMIVMMSISQINHLLVQEQTRLLKHSIFLICICFVILYTYSALIEIYWIWGLDRSRSFRLSIYRIFYYINLLTNLVYALAVLWIPKKREFISLS